MKKQVVKGLQQFANVQIPAQHLVVLKGGTDSDSGDNIGITDMIAG